MLEIRNLTKRYGRQLVFTDLFLTGHKGDIFRISGPSGAGKTTLLRCITGLERFSTGSIIMEGKTIQSDKIYLPPYQRKIGMVFQDLALWPHMNVWQNIDFVSSSIIRNKYERISWNEELLIKFHIDHKRHNYPSELSGGEQQRVALARSIANRPEVLLLDESFSNLDAALSEEIIREIMNYCKANGILMIIVTHSEVILHNYEVKAYNLSNGTLKKED